MGHHMDADGRFQSDKHPWLPPDCILLNPYRPQSEWPLLKWSDAAGFAFHFPDDDADQPRVRLLVFFEDPLNVPMLLAVCKAYKDLDGELAEDIAARLLALHPDCLEVGPPAQ